MSGGSSFLGSMIVPLVSGLVTGGIGAALYFSGVNGIARAHALSAVPVDTVANVREQVSKSGGGGVGASRAVRGIVTPLDPAKKLVEAGFPQGVVVQDLHFTSLSMAVAAGKLVERRTFVKSDFRDAGWVLQDSTGTASVDGTIGAVPLQPVATTVAHVEDHGQYQLLITEHGLSLQNSGDKERVFGLERAGRALGVGTVLTVVGAASVDPRGGLLFSAGVGPYAVTEMTLSALAAEWLSTASWTRFWGIGFLAAAGTIVVVGAVSALTSGGGGEDDRRSRTAGGK